MQDDAVDTHVRFASDLTSVHAEWMSRLASTSLLLQYPALRVHRLIVEGDKPQDVQLDGPFGDADPSVYI